MSDADLIRRFMRGDEGAFRELYRRHTPRLRATVLRLMALRVEEADDVLQDTWLAACRGIHRFRGESQFSTWLATIGIRAALSRIRSAKPATAELLDGVPAPLGASPADVLDLERSIAALPDQQRVVLILHDVEGFTHAEIGEQLGFAEGTSRSTLSRARLAMRAMLQEPVIHEH